MGHMPVEFPWKGLNDNERFSGQPPQTTRASLNMRMFDKANSRRRPTKRAGTSYFNTSPIANAPISKLDQITYDGRKASYAANSGATLVSKTTPKSQEARHSCLDRQGNFYFVDGNSTIVKLNVAGETVSTIVVPISDPSHAVVALFVDQQDNVYVGVGSGSAQNTAKMWRLQIAKGSTTPVVKWVWPPVDSGLDGCYTRRIVVRGDMLYAAHNYPDRQRSYVRAYYGALATGITEAWSTEVAYPINDLYLKPDGSVLGCSLPLLDRWRDPRFPSFSRRTVDATLRDVLPDFESRVWRWHKTKEMTGVTTNDPVTFVTDKSGKDRPLIPSLRTGATAPKWLEIGAGGNVSIMFRGESITPAFHDELQTQSSVSANAVYADGGQGFVPNYAGAKWCLAVLCRVQESGAFGAQCLFGQDNGTALENQLYFNSVYNAGIIASSGNGLYMDTGSANGIGHGGGASSPGSFDFSAATGNDTGMCLVVLGNDGANDDTAGAGGRDDGTKTHSFLRFNGKPIDRWISRAGSTTNPGYIGDGDVSTGAVKAFRGEVLEVFVLRDFANAPQGLIGCPLYPTKVTAAAPAAVAYTVGMTSFNASEVEKLEGVIAHEYGIAHLLPKAEESGGAYTAPTWAGALPYGTTNNYGNYPHPYSIATPTAGSGWGGPPRWNNAGRSEPFLMHSSSGVAWKLDASKGQLQWVVTAGPSDSGGGIGYSICCSNDGEMIYSVGPPVRNGSVRWDGKLNASTDLTIARSWVDKGTRGEDGVDISVVLGKKGWLVSNPNVIAFSGASYGGTGPTVTGTFTGYVWAAGDIFVTTAGTGVTVNAAYEIISGNAGTITLSGGSALDINGGTGAIVNLAGVIVSNWASSDIKIDVDDNDAVHFPWNFNTGTTYALKVYDRAPDGSGASNVGRLLVAYDDATHARAYSVACPASPVYRYGAAYDWNRPPDATVARTARAEFVWLCTAQTTGVSALPNATAGVMKIGLVDTTPVAGSNRTQTLLQVNGGTIKRFTAGATTSFAGANTLTLPQLSATADYIDSAILFNKVFYTDGIGYVYVDPINDVCLTVKPTDGGAIPKGCRLSCNWRGRWVLAGAQDERSNWHMSEMGNPFGWNRFPVPVTSTRAISGNNARVGFCPDMVNALVPYSDDILIFLCDHSVWQMVGDPADEGRTSGFSLVSDITGGAFGRSWTKDPDGNLYFFGSRGDVYVMRPGTSPANMTMNVIHDRLAQVDLSTYRVELAWNVDDDGLHVFLLPIGSAASPIHYFWQKGEGWFSDQMPSATSPRSLLVADGDLPNDRVLLMGASNGNVVKWDKDSKSDCGTAIHCNLLIGPLAPAGTGRCFRFRNPIVVLAPEQDGVTLNLYTSNTPETIGTLQRTWTFHPGRNQRIPIGVRGTYVWVEVDDTTSDKTFAIEEMEFDAFQAGRIHADSP